MGFGWLNSYERYNFTLIYKVRIEYEETPEYTINLTQKMIEEYNQDDVCKETFLIDF